MNIIVGHKVSNLKIDNPATGSRARMAREKLGLGIRGAAKLVGCSPSYIADLESGRRAWTGKLAQHYAKFLS